MRNPTLLRRFSGLLLSGKAATLPAIMQQAYAATPTYSDILGTSVTQIQVPIAGSVQLENIASPYGVSSTLCVDRTPSTLSVVLTGLAPEDTVFVVTSTSTGGNERYSQKLRVGTQLLTTPVVARISGPARSLLTATVSLDLTTLRSRGYDLSRGGTFYMQTVVFPSGTVTDSGLDWSRAKFSELDTITVGTCAPTYGFPGT